MSTGSLFSDLLRALPLRLQAYEVGLEFLGAPAMIFGDPWIWHQMD